MSNNWFISANFLHIIHKMNFLLYKMKYIFFGNVENLILSTIQIPLFSTLLTEFLTLFVDYTVCNIVFFSCMLKNVEDFVEM